MKRRASPRQVSVWPTLLALVMLAAALGTLLLLRGQLVQGQDSLLEGTARRFELTGHLGRPESPAVNFQDLEILREASLNELVRRLYVTKVLPDGREATVVPFHADLSDPAWRESEPWVRLAIGEPAAGYLYVGIDRSTVRTVDAAVVLLGVLLAGGMMILLFRQFGTEEQVNRLHEELDERKGQIIQLERLALAGQLSANIFHDIKKPVLNIKHEVNDALEGAHDATAVLRAISEQTELFLSMLRELGMESFVNATHDGGEWCDLRAIVDTSLRLVRYEQEGVHVEVLFDDGDFLVTGVPHRLVQVFSNLFLNAFQAMGQTGTLRVTGRRDGDALRVTVEDSGPGLPREKREELFSPFVTTRASSGGSGLGLYICRMIIEEMNGRIDASDSAELGGARFEISLNRESSGT